MPYQINGPTLDWTNDAGLFTRFTLWKQKRKLILDCQLENASDACKAKSVLQWSGDCGLEIFNSWCIKDTTDDNLQEYWCHWTAYCQPHANAQHAQFDLWHYSSQQTNPLKNTMQIYSTKVKLHFHKIGQQTSGILYHVMPLFLTFTIVTSCRNVFMKKPT